MRATQAIVVVLVMTRVAVNTKQLSCGIGKTFITSEGNLEQTIVCESSEKASKGRMDGETIEEETKKVKQ